MFRKLLLLLLFCGAALGRAEQPNSSVPPEVAGNPAAALDLNAIILRVLQNMPHDGGYSTTSVANRVLGEAITLVPGGFAIDFNHAKPSYCSIATYLVFLGTCQQLIREGQLKLDPATLHFLLVTGQPDGAGVWGRWNANGPGTARLFHELGLGTNFADWEKARPGDFMKIFWTTEIGKFERGHSVVFLGCEKEAGVEYVRFWSSNKPRGYGEKRVARSKIPYAIFSRFDRPANLTRVQYLPPRDAYLANLLTVRSSWAEARKKCGL